MPRSEAGSPRIELRPDQHQGDEQEHQRVSRRDAEPHDGQGRRTQRENPTATAVRAVAAVAGKVV